MTYSESQKITDTVRKLAEGTIFSAWFIKKDNTEREMTCRLDVKKHLRGGELGYNATQKKLITVFDMQKKGYRSINLETTTRFKIRGTVYSIQDLLAV